MLDVPLVADANYLYKELFEADKLLRRMKQDVGDENAGDERLSVYNSFKAVVGLGDPINEKLKAKQVRGILKEVLGSSPKYGTVQRKLISSTVDNVGRAVITPNPQLDMDSIGLPENAAFDVYAPHIARRLHRAGVPLVRGLQEIRDRSPRARQALLQEMENRYVYANRAPVLHKHGFLAFRPVLVKSDTLQISPLVTKGFAADFDGDQMNFSVPSGEKARLEALQELLPSKKLLSAGDYKSPVHQPGQQYVGGVYRATAPPDPTKQPRVFASVAAAKRALEEGSLGVNDPIVIQSGT